MSGKKYEIIFKMNDSTYERVTLTSFSLDDFLKQVGGPHGNFNYIDSEGNINILYSHAIDSIKIINKDLEEK